MCFGPQALPWLFFPFLLYSHSWLEILSPLLPSLQEAAQICCNHPVLGKPAASPHSQIPQSCSTASPEWLLQSTRNHSLPSGVCACLGVGHSAPRVTPEPSVGIRHPGQILRAE